MKIINKGTETAYVPGDAGTIVVKPGKTADMRLGEADFAVRTIPGVEFVGETVTPKAVSEARVEAAVVPIAEHIAAKPADNAYAVLGQVPGSGKVEVIDGVQSVQADVAQSQGQAISEDLRGQDLDAALEAAGLSKAGNAEAKRARYAEYLQAASSTPAS